MTDFHVVFGAGQVGSRLAGLLRTKGKRVRIVRRSAGAAGTGIEVLSGDAAVAARATVTGARETY
jgi:nucleoside-diphosphate-sugar epimerase